MKRTTASAVIITLFFTPVFAPGLFAAETFTVTEKQAVLDTLEKMVSDIETRAANSAGSAEASRTAGASPSRSAEFAGKVAEYMPEANLAWAHAGNILGYLSDALALYESFDQYLKAKQALSAIDKTCDGDILDGFGPQVPSACAAGTSAEALNALGGESSDTGDCLSCYAKAVQDINHIRRVMTELSCRRRAVLAYGEYSLMLGEASAILPGTQAAWNAAGKPQIIEGINSFKNTYNNKIREGIGRLTEVLQEYGQCEAKYLGNDDWYERFGFIYPIFVESRYMAE